MSERVRRAPLPPTAYHILLCLIEGPLHGYAMKSVVEERTDGVVRLGAGTLYHAIKSLRDKGYVVETEAPKEHESPNPRLRFYAITAEGKEILAMETERLAADVALARKKLATLKGIGE